MVEYKKGDENLKFFGFAKRNFHMAVFALFIVLTAVTMCFTVAFGDDYYYGSFFYEGFAHFISENLLHYRETNGRALVHLLDELILCGNQMAVWHIFGTLCVSGVVFLSALISSRAYINGLKTKEFRISLTVSCLLFSSISLDIARQSIYWATGALNYLFPVLLLLALFYCVKRGESEGRIGALVPILAFLCAFSTEQCSAGAIAVIFYAFILRLKLRKKPDTAMYLSAVSVALGAALLFLAPGNTVRMTYYPEFYAKPVLERIAGNIPAVTNGMTGKDGMGTAFAFLFACHIGASLRRLKNKHEIWRIAPIALCAAAVVLISVNSADITAGIIRTVVVLAALIDVAAEKMIAFFREGDDGAFFILLSVILQLCMLISPEYGGRTVLVSFILLFPAIEELIGKEGGVLSLVLTAATAALIFSYGHFILACITAAALAALAFALLKKPQVSRIFILAIICALCFDSMLSFARGYGENYAVHKSNSEAIESWKVAGDTDAPLCLEYLINGEYKYIMPYDNVPYHWNWYKTYHHLPPETEMIFDFPKER